MFLKLREDYRLPFTKMQQDVYTTPYFCSYNNKYIDILKKINKIKIFFINIELLINLQIFINMQQAIKINYSLAKAIIKKNRLNQMSTYFLLSSLYEGRTIKNFKERLTEIAKANGTTEKTLKSHVKQLIEDGLAFMRGEELVLYGKKKICIFFKVTYVSCFKYVINEKYNSKGIKLLIRTLVIKDNIAHQTFKLRKKSSNSSNTRIKKYKRRYLDALIKNNNLVSLSQFGYAKLMGLKTSSGGCYHIQKLAQVGFINNKRVDPKFIMNGDKRALNEIRENDIKGAYFINNNGKIYKRLPNKISINF